MISPFPGSFSSSFFAGWMFFGLSPTPTGGSPSEALYRNADDSIVRQEQEPEETVQYFPDYVDGGGWSVQLMFSNVDPDTAASIQVEVYDPDGQPVPDLFDSELTLEIPALGARVLKSTGSGAIRRGWIQFETNAATVRGWLTYRHAPSGIEAVVEPAPLGPEFALFVEESETVGTGLALFNPASATGIELRLRDEAGNDPLNGLVLAWKDFHQAALTLPEWFDVSGWMRNCWRIFAASCS